MIVDDDEMIRIDLEKRIGEMPGLKLVASCASAKEAAGILMAKKIDLVFLDVQLPDMNGMKLLSLMDGQKPTIIMITSRREYAAEAFEHEVTDFLVKPFTDERFLKAVLRATKTRQSNPSTANPDHIFVRVNSILEKIHLSEILFIEAMADYVQIQTPKQRYIVHSTMKGMEQTLDGNKFMRVHNSYIVQLSRIARIEDNSIVIGEKIIPVSRARIKPLLEQINLLKAE